MNLLRPLGLALAFAAGSLAAAPADAGSISEKIKHQQEHVHQVHERLNQRRGALNAAKVKVSSLQSQLAETEHGMLVVQTTLAGIGAQIRSNQRRLSWNEIQLKAARTTLTRHNDALRRRLVDVYEHGDMGYVNVLLASTSFIDFVERWDDIKYLIKANEQTVRQRRDAERHVSNVQNRLLNDAQELERARARQRQAQSQLDALASERRTLVAAADQERRQVAQQVAELEGLSAAEEAALERLIVERQREEQARRDAARRAALLAGKAPEPVLGGPGVFSWPVSGPITSPYGLRTNPFGGGGMDFHPGLDIGAPMGATIIAAAGGRIIYAGWYGGYGNAVIVDHGANTVSLYGHCSQVFVGVGQDVQRGQAIAAIGSTGVSTGPHLHFEVRVNGKPRDTTPLLH